MSTTEEIENELLAFVRREVFGPDVEVLAPAALRRRVAEAHRTAAVQYR